MFRNRLPTSVEMLGNSIRRHRLDRDQRNDRPACRVGYGLENISFHDYEKEYATKRLRMSSATERFRESSGRCLLGMCFVEGRNSVRRANLSMRLRLFQYLHTSLSAPNTRR